MSHFSKGGSPRANFGKNTFLRSTQDVKTEPYTVARSTVTAETVDGKSVRVLQSGEVLAKITSGTEAGKVGPFQEDATDGRQTLANIVGINDTFLPWQLNERDVEVAAVYEATVVQAWCFERNAAGARITLTNTTAAELVGKKSLDIKFK